MHLTIVGTPYIDANLSVVYAYIFLLLPANKLSLFIFADFKKKKWQCSYHVLFQKQTTKECWWM